MGFNLAFKGLIMEIHCKKNLKVAVAFEAIWILKLDFLSIYNIICLLNER